jgi:sec-independent protein translocase protein TatA
MLVIGMPGTTELLVICAIAFLLFGAKVFPRFMKGLGEGVREFRKIGKDMNDAVEELETETETSKKVKK